MSGIAVIHNLDGKAAEPQVLTRMLNAIAHRAVDGRGTWIYGATAMGHAHMWTTPESLREQQPYCARIDDRPYCLVLDGRIDNRAELRETLVDKGFEARDNTDAELVLDAWRCWGEEAPRKILGDFAYVIWDGPQRKLFCARDTCGVRPLFYYYNAHTLLCASELHQLFECPVVPREPNAPVIAEYLCATLTSPEDTLFRELRRLPPAHYLLADQRGVRVRRYYDLDSARTIRYRTDEQYAGHFAVIFKEAVRCRLRSHASIAAELSGGLDSSSVVAMLGALQREGRGCPQPPECFSIVYEEPECDERQYAKQMALASGFRCSFVAPTLPDYGKCWEQVRRYSDLPDYVNGAVFDGLRNRAVQRGSRVVLSGLGGDQWLQGTENYLADLIKSFRWRELVREMRCDRRFGNHNRSGEKFTALLRWGVRPLLPKPMDRSLRQLLGRPLYLDAIERALADQIGLPARLDREPAFRRSMPYAQRSIYRCWTSPWMIHLLEMDDRSNAWAGVEGRHPFYDRRVVEFCFAIPEEQRAPLGLTKFVLRNAMKGLLPESIRERRTKSIFGRVFIDTFKRLGGELVFENMTLDEKGWVSGTRMKQLCRERLLGYPSDLWPLWTTFAAELWFREVFASPAEINQT